ncbi:MAG: hypothetical protein JOZ19_06305 [Rubrobacter sp.]|nr:hypothetical protein [Rubrobacter sp.]
MHQQETWPALPLGEWHETYTTLHMYSQVVGKVRLESSPMTNHWWQVPLYLTARGLTTSPISHADKSFQLDFDFFEHELVILTSKGEVRRIPLGSAVKNFYARILNTLEELGVAVEIWPVPVEVANPVPFEHDERLTYDPAYAHRFWQVLRRVDAVFKQFRARFSGKCSPVQFYWGSFDLAVTRFSGRAALPDSDADVITRFSYNAELSSLGFWPGGTFPADEGMREVDAAFYSYTFPEPPGFSDQPVSPERASYDLQLGEFLLSYDDVRSAADPEREILDFAQSTYEAGARLQGWPMDELALQD